MDILPNTPAKALNFIAITIGVVLLAVAMIYGGPILIPLIFALCVWMILNDTAAAISRISFGGRHIPMWLSLLIGLLLFTIIILRIGTLLYTNISQLITDLPAYARNLDGLLRTVPGWIWKGVLGENAAESGPMVEQLGAIAVDYVSNSASVIAGILAGMASTAAYVAVYVMFLLLEQGTFAAKVKRMFKDSVKRAEFAHMIDSIHEQIQTYLRVKTLVSLATGVISYVIMLLFGLEYALIWAILFFALNFIPNIGSIIATAFPILMGLLQFPSLSTVALMAVALVTVQTIIGNFVEPRMLGNQLNISPLVVLVALVVFGSIWGIAGAFLSVPLMVVIMIVLSHFESTHVIAVMLSGDGIVHDVVSEREAHMTRLVGVEGNSVETHTHA